MDLSKTGRFQKNSRKWHFAQPEFNLCSETWSKGAEWNGVSFVIFLQELGERLPHLVCSLIPEPNDKMDEFCVWTCVCMVQRCVQDVVSRVLFFRKLNKKITHEPLRQNTPISVRDTKTGGTYLTLGVMENKPVSPNIRLYRQLKHALNIPQRPARTPNVLRVTQSQQTT